MERSNSAARCFGVQFSAASNYYFTGSMRYAAVYSTVLTAQQVSNHYAAGQ